MIILFLSNAASIHTVRWVNALSQRGHKVHLVYKFDDIAKIDKISPKVTQHRLKYSGTKGYFLNAFQLRKLANFIKPDVVNAHYSSGYGTLARISRLKPLILSVWGSDVYEFPYQSKFKNKLVVDNLKYADEIASTSYCMAEQVKKLLKDNTKFIAITPFGVDLKLFKRFNISTKKEIVIGNIKSLKEIYGLDYLIKAIKIIKTQFELDNELELSNRIKLYIWGDGPELDNLISLTKELKIGDTVFFKGKISNNEVPKALESIDIFCATSLQESFGVSLIEAMAMELPIVATDIPGFREIVDNKENGFIVENKNPSAIGKALKTLICDKELRISMGQLGRKKVEELYNWDENVEHMISLYKSKIKTELIQ